MCNVGDSVEDNEVEKLTLNKNKNYSVKSIKRENMNWKCLFGHIWDGCKCKRCGKTRDEQHDWDGCKCKRCGRARDEQHDWNGCKCKRCGKIRDEQHDWYGYRCKRCGLTRPFEPCKDVEHEWVEIETTESKECIGWHGESPYEKITTCITYRCQKCGTEKTETSVYSPI